LRRSFVNPEESSSRQNMRETPRRKDRDLEKYPPPFAASNMKYHATGAAIHTLRHFVPKSP